MDTLSYIRQPILAELEEYRAHFNAALSHPDDYLGMALQHVRSKVGKMMRPMLVLLVAKEFGDVSINAIRSAVALELLHTASLIHDDVVDESEERRGKKSLNAVFDNKVAVLVGDYMLSRALLESALTQDMRIVEVISRLGGELAEGEVKQIANTRTTTFSEAIYYEIIQHKTASLFKACAQLGAISGGASPQKIEAAVQLAEIIGLCFQIRDDIFDFEPSAQIGKPTGLDMQEGKLTLPALYAVNAATEEWVRPLAAKIKAGEGSKADIQRLIDYTCQQGGIDYAMSHMHALHRKGTQLLEEFSNPQVKAALQTYLDFTIDRNK